MMDKDFRTGGAVMAARFCPQCGHEQSSAAKFCTHCGASLMGSAAASPPAVTRVDAAARGTRRLLLPLGVVVMVVLAAAVAILAYRLTHTPAPPLTNAVAEYVPPAPPLTNATDQYVPPAPPLTDAPTTGPGQLPPDVAVYVEFLKGIEKRRMALDNTDYSGINSALSQAVNAQNVKNAQNATDGDEGGSVQPPHNGNNTSTQISQSLSGYETAWQTLIGDYRSQNPPKSCTLLANSYYLFLDDDSTGVNKLHVGVQNLLDDVNNQKPVNAELANLTSDLLTTHTKQDQEGTAADDALTQLCSLYHAPKPFSIVPEGASSSLLGP